MNADFTLPIGCAVVIIFYYVYLFIFSKLFDFYYLFMNTASIINGFIIFLYIILLLLYI